MFVPGWRLDDIMISYAAEGGSVGPHFDQYDVFLIQAAGQRHWQLGPQCDEHSRLRGDADCVGRGGVQDAESHASRSQ